MEYFSYGNGEKSQIVSEIACTVNDLEPGAVFFDIDSVWSSHKRRSALLPELKNKGLKSAVYIYDIIPVTYPQYCHENTMFFHELLGCVSAICRSYFYLDAKHFGPGKSTAVQIKAPNEKGLCHLAGL